MISHSGEVFGFTSENIILPRDKIAVTVLTNQEAFGAAGAIANKVMGLLLSHLAGKTSESTEQVLQIFLGFQEGKIDHALFICNCKAYFDEQAWALMLHPKSISAAAGIFLGREGMEGRHNFSGLRCWLSHYSSARYHLLDAGGKIEQYVVAPVE